MVIILSVLIFRIFMVPVVQICMLNGSYFICSLLGLQQFLDLGVPADHLVLGVPWYGINYLCLALSEVLV